MKIRTGFVSNSSSSSFVLITTEKTFNAVLDSLGAKERKFIKKVMNEMTESKKDAKIFGRDVIVMSGTYDSDYLYDEFDKIFTGPPKKIKENGCKHLFDREKIKFCSECGERAIVEKEVEEEIDFEEKSFEVLEDFFKSFSGKKDSYAHLGEY